MCIKINFEIPDHYNVEVIRHSSTNSIVKGILYRKLDSGVQRRVSGEKTDNCTTQRYGSRREIS